MSVKVTWVGGPGEPDVNQWNGITFKKGEAVELTNPSMIEKAKTNRFYDVEGVDKKRPDEDPPEDNRRGRRHAA